MLNIQGCSNFNCKLSLKSKMAITVTLLTAIMLAWTGHVFSRLFGEEFKKSISRQNYTLVSSLAAEVDGKLLSARDHLVAVSTMIAPDVLSSKDKATSFLEGQRDNQILFDNGLFLFTPSLVPLATVGKSPYHCLAECPFEKYLKKTLETGLPWISEPFFSSQNVRRPVIMFTSPVRGGDGRIIGLIAGTVDLMNDNFLGSLASVRLGDNGYLYLFNRDRTIIVHKDRERILENDVPPGANMLFDRAVGGFEGTGETVTSKGLHALSSFKVIPTTGWILSANFPIDEAYAPVRAVRHHFFIALLIMAATCAVATWYLMRRLTLPLGDLAQQMLSFSADERPDPIKIGVRDEIGALAEIFNNMISVLSEKENALGEQLVFLQLLIDVMPNPVFFKDASGLYLGCNKAFEKFIGVTKSELIGKTVFDFAPAELATVYYDADHALLDQGPGKTQVYESSVRWHDGIFHQVIFYKATFAKPDGKTGGIVGTIVDINDRKKAEMALQEQKQFSENILLNATAATFVIDADHKVIAWNRACEKLTGVPPETLLNSRDHWVAFFDHKRPCLADFIIDGNLDDIHKYYAEVRQSSLAEDGLTAEGWRTINGKKCYIVFHAAPIRDGSGRVIAAIQTLEDITSRKQAEDDLCHSISLLEATLESTGDGILVIDHKGENVIYNKQFSGMWETKEIMHGDDKIDILSLLLNKLEDPHSFRKNLTALRVHPALEILDLIRLKDGRIFEYLSRPQRLNDIIVGRVFSFRDITQKQKILDQLNRLSMAVEQSPNTVIITDREGTIEYVNPTFAAVTGYDSGEIIGRNPRILKAGTLPAEYYRTLWETIASGQVWRGELQNKKKNGELFWESALISPLKNSDGVITNFVGIKEDITKKKLAEQRQLLTGQVLGILALQSNKTDKIQDILQLIKDFTKAEAVALRLARGDDLDYHATMGFEDFPVNAPCHLTAKYCDEDVLLETLCGRIFKGATDGLPGGDMTPHGSFWVCNGFPQDKRICPLTHCSDAAILSMAVIPLRAGDRVIGLLQLSDRRANKFNAGEIAFLETLTSTIGIALEHRKTETSLQEKEAYLNYVTSHDPLTGLPNRALFSDRFQHALAKAKRTGKKAALLFLDLDRFKTVNDSLGYEVGDHILCLMSTRIKSVVRESDTLARLGGDEFVLVVEEVDDPKNILLLGQNLLEILSEPLLHEGHQLYLTASIGISLFPGDGSEMEPLLTYAEVAMFRAKELGRNNCQFYRPEMNIRNKELLFLQGSLRQALLENQFLLHYQPQVDLETGRIAGVEALVRWHHPGLGVIPPGDFIPLAEETGLILPLDNWVLRNACQSIVNWMRADGIPLRVAVNISARQFNDPGFIDKVDDILRDTGMNPRLLEIEITESVFMDNVDCAISIMTKLKERGINLAVDDFGTGYSSLSYLHKFPITHLKIDRSFVNDACSNPQSAEIVSSIIALAKNMQIRVIAEGVETADQKAFLKKAGCDEGQGFLFGRPQPWESLQQIVSMDFCQVGRGQPV